MSNRTTPVSVSLLRQIEQLANAGVPDAAIAAQLQAAGHVMPRDAADHHALAHPTGYNLPVADGDPSRWSGDAVAAIRTSETFMALADDGFAVNGSVQLVL